jgi:Uma2 family endonuclease
MVTKKRLLTPRDFECMVEAGRLDDDTAYELVQGEVLALSPASHYHAQICVFISAVLLRFALQIGAIVLSESAGYVVGADRQQVRSPDVSLITRERAAILPAGHAFGTEAPDLAVEVLSPEQHGESYARPKVAEYLAAGGRVVWLVDPDSRTVRVYERGASEYSIYPAESEITLDAIAPGFSATVSTFFP